jgi:hypothetical protein
MHKIQEVPMTRHAARKEGRGKASRKRGLHRFECDFTGGDKLVERILNQIESEVI